MIEEPCTCNPVPVQTSLQGEMMDGVDSRGRWHGIKVNGVFHPLTIVAPSAAEIAKNAANEAAAQVVIDAEQTKMDRMEFLRQRRRDDFDLTTAEQQEVMDFQMGV